MCVPGAATPTQGPDIDLSTGAPVPSTAATDTALLEDTRARLWARRGTCALFDSDAFRQHLEAVYQTMYQEHGQRFSSRPR